MKCNVGGVDRAVRIVVGIALLGFGYAAATGVTAVIAYAIGGILLLTGLIRFCPISSVLGLNTCGER